MSQYLEEIERRRTFAVISHPDTGKTTLTEKLLLFGGATHVAETVKSSKIKKAATSGWMEIGKQRGISVTTSVMTLDYSGHKINILSTPGHQDLAEGTLRTLTAVGSVIVVVDITKGVEAQTRKLMEVYRMRKTPMIVFVSKMSRDSKDPFDLLDEVEEELQMKVRPLSWPIDMGQRLWGVYNILEQELNLHTPDKQYVTENVEFKDITSPNLKAYIGPMQTAKPREGIELIERVYPEFNVNTYLDGDIALVFFGSALNNSGAEELSDCFIRVASSSRPIHAVERVVDPNEDNFIGPILKIRASIDPSHRSCIVFMKIYSGRFERNVNYKHVRFGKMMHFSNPTASMVQKKEMVNEAFAGDIIGLPDTGNFKIGDTLISGEELHFKGLPSFSPEMFKYIENADPTKAKRLNEGIEQLMDESVAQLFTN